MSAVLDSGAYIVFRSHACPDALRRRLSTLSTAHVPDLFDSEVLNVARHGHLAGRFDHPAVAEIAAHLRTGRFQRHPVRSMLEDIWALQDDLTVYDAAYVALAARLGLPLLTVDQRLAGAPDLPCRVEVY